MPQHIRVMQCFDCKIFQADIVKKSKRWKCRVCGVQQSVRKEVFRGTGSECRTKAQELNMQKCIEQNKDLNYLLIHLNNGGESNEIRSCRSVSNLHNDVNEINWRYVDKASKEQNLNDSKITKENTNMFNFSNTQKWSKDKSVENSLKLFNEEHNDGIAKKKSKWDIFV